MNFLTKAGSIPCYLMEPHPISTRGEGQTEGNRRLHEVGVRPRSA